MPVILIQQIVFSAWLLLWFRSTNWVFGRNVSGKAHKHLPLHCTYLRNVSPVAVSSVKTFCTLQGAKTVLKTAYDMLKDSVGFFVSVLVRCSFFCTFITYCLIQEPSDVDATCWHARSKSSSLIICHATVNTLWMSFSLKVTNVYIQVLIELYKFCNYASLCYCCFGTLVVSLYVQHNMVPWSHQVTAEKPFWSQQSVCGSAKKSRVTSTVMNVATLGKPSELRPSLFTLTITMCSWIWQFYCIMLLTSANIARQTHKTCYRWMYNIISINTHNNHVSTSSIRVVHFFSNNIDDWN